MSGSRPPRAKVGDFTKCTRAWSEDLEHPIWGYVASSDTVVLAGPYYRPDKPLKRWHRVDTGTSSDKDLGFADVATEEVVSIDELPPEVWASFVAWRLAGEP